MLFSGPRIAKHTVIISLFALLGSPDCIKHRNDWLICSFGVPGLQKASKKNITNIYDVPLGQGRDVPLWAVCCLLLARLLPAAVYWVRPLMFAGVTDTFRSKHRVRGDLDGCGEVSGGGLGELWGSWESFGDPRWGSRSSLGSSRGPRGGAGWLSGSLWMPWELPHGS